MMTVTDQSFVKGLFWRMLAIGGVLAMVSAVIISARVGYSLALGTLCGALSLRVTTVATGRMIRGALQGSSRAGLWGVVLALKLVLVFFAVWICLVIFKAQAIAYVLGYKVIFPALLWQSIAQPVQFDEPVEDADENGSL